MTNVLGPTSLRLQPSHPRGQARIGAVARSDDTAQAREVEPNTLSRELGLAIAHAHQAWAKRHAPHLLEEWLA